MNKSELRSIVEKEIYEPLVRCRDVCRQYFRDYPEEIGLHLPSYGVSSIHEHRFEEFDTVFFGASLNDITGDDVDVFIMDNFEFHERFGDEDLFGKDNVPLDIDAITDAVCEVMPKYIEAFKKELRALDAEIEKVKID